MAKTPAAAPSAGISEGREPSREQAQPVRESSEWANPAPDDDLASFFGLSTDLLCIAGLDGYFNRLNAQWTRTLGWSQAELLAKPFIEFVHPEDTAATGAAMAGLSHGGEIVGFENRYRHRDGTYRWLQWNARPVPNEDRVYAVARDVTRQKRLEAEVLAIAEGEKVRLGHELHDGLCQSLAGIAAFTAALHRKLVAQNDQEHAGAVQEIIKLVNGTMSDARDMAHGLGHFGAGLTEIETALETLSANVQSLFSVPCSFEVSAPFPSLRPEVAGNLFRIAQQALTNAVTHAQPASIRIHLSHKAGTGTLSIRDDGIGLQATEESANGFGFSTMQYRARAIGANLEVRPRTSAGTEVICTFSVADGAGTGAAHDNE